MNTELSAGRNAIQGKKDVLVNDLKGVVGDADELLREVASSTAQGFATARTKVESKLGEARIAVTEKAKGAADATNVYVRENPWKALGVATVAGLIIGVLLSRR